MTVLGSPPAMDTMLTVALRLAAKTTSRSDAQPTLNHELPVRSQMVWGLPEGRPLSSATFLRLNLLPPLSLAHENASQRPSGERAAFCAPSVPSITVVSSRSKRRTTSTPCGLSLSGSSSGEAVYTTNLASGEMPINWLKGGLLGRVVET
jgi:hypothetical protein